MSGADLLREFWHTWEVDGQEGVSQYVRDVSNVITDLSTQLEQIDEIAPDVFRAKVHGTKVPA